MCLYTHYLYVCWGSHTQLDSATSLTVPFWVLDFSDLFFEFDDSVSQSVSHSVEFIIMLLLVVLLLLSLDHNIFSLSSCLSSLSGYEIVTELFGTG